MSKFEDVQRNWPWHAGAKIEGVQPFDLAIDGGGSHVIKRVIERRPGGVLVQFGAFLGGAARRWLAENPSLRCICVDLWGDDSLAFAKSLPHKEWATKKFGRQALENHAALLAKHGLYRVVQNNLYEFRDRCVLVRLGFDAAVRALWELGLAPEIAYFDAIRTRRQYRMASQAFPDAILTGHNWSWRDANGRQPVRDLAFDLARQRHGLVFGHWGNFVISELRHGPNYDLTELAPFPADLDLRDLGEIEDANWLTDANRRGYAGAAAPMATQDFQPGERLVSDARIAALTQQLASARAELDVFSEQVAGQQEVIDELQREIVALREPGKSGRADAEALGRLEGLLRGLEAKLGPAPVKPRRTKGAAGAGH